jgi:Cu/Ag efflux pump CusA
VGAEGVAVEVPAQVQVGDEVAGDAPLMLASLVRFSVRHPGIVLGLAVVLVVYGASRLFAAPLDVFPEFAPPQVSIQTEAPGFAPEQVEILVTKPIEDVINGVAGIAIVRSQSIQGLSIITAVLAPGTDIFRARQALAERLVEAVPRLPRSVPPPVISPLTSSSSTVLVIGFTSTTRTLLEQRTVVDWMVRPRLLTTPGVAKVASFGGEVRQLQVQVDPARLRAYGVGLAELTEVACRSTGIRGVACSTAPISASWSAPRANRPARSHRSGRGARAGWLRAPYR